MIPSICKFWKRQNYGDSKKISGCEVSRERMNRQNRGFFRAVEITLHVIIIVDTLVFLSKPIELYTKSEP